MIDGTLNEKIAETRKRLEVAEHYGATAAKKYEEELSQLLMLQKFATVTRLTVRYLGVCALMRCLRAPAGPGC